MAEHTYAVVKHTTMSGDYYTVALLFDIGGTLYGRHVMQQEYAWPVQFTSKARARLFAKGLGKVASHIYEAARAPTVDALEPIPNARDRFGLTAKGERYASLVMDADDASGAA